MDERKNKVLGLVITDGVGFRNFILSDFPAQAVLCFKKVIIFSALPRNEYNFKVKENIEVKELPVFVEPFTSWLLRKAKELAHLHLHKNFFGINDNLRKSLPKGNSNRARATRILFRITQKFHSEGIIQKLERLQKSSLRKNKLTRECKMLLEKSPPDLLFFTHQRPPYVMPLLVAANDLKIKTSAFIFSWDNLSSKGRMAATFDNCLVWSELMKRELLYFYPSMKTENVEVVGTPQFEPYVIPKFHKEKVSFFNRFDLNPDLRTICYSCGDISTSPNDELYIITIAESILQEGIIMPVNFIVRTSPAEDPKRFFHLKKEFSFIKWNYPDWTVAREDHPEPWSQRVPSEKDIKELRSLLEYSDLNINMCSTMSLDFMLFDKPVINAVFGNEENELYNDQRFLKFSHYERVVQSGAVKIAKDRKALIEAINFYLQNPSAGSKEREALLALQIGKPLKGTSERISYLLREIIRS